jgi:hypothetical protein
MQYIYIEKGLRQRVFAMLEEAMRPRERKRQSKKHHWPSWDGTMEDTGVGRTALNRGAEGISGRVVFCRFFLAGCPKKSFRKNSDSPDRTLHLFG